MFWNASLFLHAGVSMSVLHFMTKCQEFVMQCSHARFLNSYVHKAECYLLD